MNEYLDERDIHKGWKLAEERTGNRATVQEAHTHCTNTYICGALLSDKTTPKHTQSWHVTHRFKWATALSNTVLPSL